MVSSIGLIRLASADEAMEDRDKDALEDFEDAYPEELMTELARFVRLCFGEARDHKRKDQQRFIDAMYARKGEYTPQKLAQIKQTGASEEYARIVANKSRILESWLRDIFLAHGERPWTVSASPSPDLPETDLTRVKQEVGQELAAAFAAGMPVDQVSASQLLSDRIDTERLRKKDLADRRAERMEVKIADQLHEGGFEKAFSDFLAFLVTYPGAIFKGPIFRRNNKVRWEEADGTYIPIVDTDITMEFEAVDPNNAYPAPGTTTPQEGYFLEHITLTARDLHEMIGVEGYSESAIRTVLDRAVNGGYRWLDDMHMSPAGSESNEPDVKRRAEHTGYIDVLEFHGPVQGKKLVEWGMDDIEDEQEYYEATVMLVDDQVVKAVLNDDPMGRRPYYKACYEDIPGKFWGYSLYDVLSDVQGVCNAAIRSLVNNLGIASGPQVVVNSDRLPPGEDITNMYPWKIWQIIDGQYGDKGAKPLDFFQPSSNVNDHLMVLDKFYALADDFSLIPRYMSGSDKVSGPGRTATGLSMLLDAANKGLKSLVQGIDAGVMSPLLEQLFDHNMIYSDDDSIKGDSQVMARGVASLMQLETLRMRRNEFLQITNNPIDSQIVGVDGRASVLREIAKGLGMDVNEIVPPKTQLANQQQQPPPEAGGQPAASPQQSQEQLETGEPVADSASPSGMM